MTSAWMTQGGRNTVAAVFTVVAVVLISSTAFAQSDTPPKWDLFAGYQYLHPGGTVPEVSSNPTSPTPFTLPSMSKGGGAAFTYNFDSYWGGEVDSGYNRDTASASSEWTVSAGPRFMLRREDTNLFVHALGSFNRLTYSSGVATSNGIGVILGGGMDLPINKTWAWRLFEVDYVWAKHNFANYAAPNFSDLRRPSLEGVRLRTGVLISWGGAPAVAPAASCSVQPTEVFVGEPITATVTASNFNPKHSLTYAWTGTGGQVTGKDTSATIDTSNTAPGNYSISARVTDSRSTKNNEASCTANFTIKPLPPKNPPTVSMSADPSSLLAGGPVNLTATCSSPDGVPVSVANWSSTLGSVSGTGSSATLNTAGLPPGPVTVTAICTDSRGLNTQASAQINIENPPPPQVDKSLEARLTLHSVYFQTSKPPVTDPSAGLLPSQQRILTTLATDFKKYLEAKPDAHLVLEGHADIRGPAAYNQALSERRVARVKSFLVEQGVPDTDIETKAFGAQQNLTTEEVRTSIEQNNELTAEERTRALAKLNVIKLASNRRVDVTLNAGGTTQTSTRQFPFNSTDALTLIGGRESEVKKAPARRAPGKPAPKQ
jgi:outer membrane protein OmpA-like peptidoglycan-associated protein